MTVHQDTRLSPRDSGPQDQPIGSGRIVVGVDGSGRSMAALEWALEEARLRGCSVEAVMAWQHPQAYGAANVVGLGMDPSLETEEVLATSAAAEAVRRAGQNGAADAVPTTWEAVEGHPAEVLVGTAEDADLLVVGSRGHGGFVGMLLGSVSQHVLAHAKCPVVVVPDPQHRH
jgi:nucleotide-binding universal stress UspA family protein